MSLERVELDPQPLQGLRGGIGVVFLEPFLGSLDSGLEIALAFTRTPSHAVVEAQVEQAAEHVAAFFGITDQELLELALGQQHGSAEAVEVQAHELLNLLGDGTRPAHDGL